MAIDQTPPTPACRQRCYIGTDGADHPVVRRVTVPARTSVPVPPGTGEPATPAQVRPVAAVATSIRPATVAVPAPIAPIATGAGEAATGTTPAPAAPRRVFPVRPPRLLNAVRRHRAGD